jgi:hypothetical protein
MAMSETENAALLAELKQTWCHRMGVPVFDPAAFNTFVLARLAKDAAAKISN